MKYIQITDRSNCLKQADKGRDALLAGKKAVLFCNRPQAVSALVTAADLLTKACSYIELPVSCVIRRVVKEGEYITEIEYRRTDNER